ncbi:MULTISPECIES: type ISP restriction/modification enzyme [Streptomyces]|uniref:DNA methyltransferase n=1 Tax=Streptomyces glycanivorans TaxID=3033808 RepID=A0ABY9JI68_9ACTN|nr:MULTISPECIES: type ISP restriction/modification enzyme [unclassified Streptomyces]WLQ67428.1 DNA methyltransferase [Streptomyces sp. Alt3]WSR05806.1 DNA methyltransferase [Streptomyces sp. NBC_01208]WSR51586.1 DNA methyltransferase [Streptomyces sp. NBC_01201]
MAARVAAGAGGGDALPLLDDLMPWSVRPLRTGRPWVTAPDASSLRARWDLLARAEGAEQERLFRPSRSRTPLSPAAALPGTATGTGAFARDPGPYPEPVRILHGPFDKQWLIPDHRLLDAARPELWRVADGHQIFAVEHGYVPQDDGPCLSATALLPDGHSPAGRPGRTRPLHRRPGGQEPNLAPGLTALLSERYGAPVTAESVLAWILAAARPSPAGPLVPLPMGGGLWAQGVELGQELMRLQLRGARGGERPRLPGGRRPYVRAAIGPRPDSISFDAGEEVLVIGEGRVSPVPAAAWDFRVGGVRVLELWFERRTAAAEGLAAVGPRDWPRERTSELLELITVLALLAGLRPRQEELREAVGRADTLTRDGLRAAGVLPVPAWARRPASVLDHREEGPEGQFALL